MASTDLTKLQRIQDWLASIVTKSPPFTCSLPLQRSLNCLPSVKIIMMFKTSYFLTCESLPGKQVVYLHSMLAPSLPSRSLRSNKGITLSVPGIGTNTGVRAFHYCALSLCIDIQCLSFQPLQLQSLKNFSGHISLTWPFPHRHQHTRRPVDVMELLWSLDLVWRKREQKSSIISYLLLCFTAKDLSQVHHTYTWGSQI